MAIPYHTHRFSIPTATKADVRNGTRTDIAVVPAAVGSASVRDESYFATAEQGQKADTALQPGDIGPTITDPIQQFIDNGFPNHQPNKPYNQGSYVRYVTGGGAGVYRSRIPNNTTIPNNTANWDIISNLAFKSNINISDINASGSPDDTNYLRGDGSWSVPITLVNGRDSFVINSSQPFPPSGTNVVYAMNGPDASTDPNATFWYQLGSLSSRNINGNENQFLNGQGNWVGIPVQQTGFWINLFDQPNMIWEDENILIRLIQDGTPESQNTHYGLNIKNRSDIMFYNGNDSAIYSFVTEPISDYQLAYNLFEMHLLNSHYRATGNRLFVDKRSVDGNNKT